MAFPKRPFHALWCARRYAASRQSRGAGPYKVCGFPPTTRRKSYVFVGAGAHDSPCGITPFVQTPRLQSLRHFLAKMPPRPQRSGVSTNSRSEFSSHLHKGGLWKVPANNTAIRNKLWMRREQAPRPPHSGVSTRSPKVRATALRICANSLIRRRRVRLFCARHLSFQHYDCSQTPKSLKTPVLSAKIVKKLFPIY